MVIDRFRLGGTSRVVEIASNDGYLLRYFMAKGIPVLGVEPAANVAADAISKGFRLGWSSSARPGRGRDGRNPGRPAGGNNVLAQVPDLNDFVRAWRFCSRPGGVITMEFPHLLRLIEGSEFDTIYHEHFSYFSLISVERAFGRHGLKSSMSTSCPTHGGSLRIYATHARSHRTRQRADRGIEGAGEAAGLDRLDVYCGSASGSRRRSGGCWSS